MAKAKAKAQTEKPKTQVADFADDIAALAAEPFELVPVKSVPRFDFRVSTGSTKLDMAISGRRCWGGGIPGGILVELFGPSGAGKTGLMLEILASIQAQGGTAYFRDPESRLDLEWAEKLGAYDFDYKKVPTVEDLYTDVGAWLNKQLDPKVLHAYFIDSSAALCTQDELDDTENPMGTEKAKMFSIFCRKLAVRLSAQNRVVIMSNQVRQNISRMPNAPKEIVPGGEAVKFYSSLRLRVYPAMGHKIPREKIFNGKKVVNIVGINSGIYVAKSSLDAAYRDTNLTFLFDYGIDDLGDNASELVKYRGGMTFPDGKEYKIAPKIIEYAEAHNYENVVRQEYIKLWREIDELFKEKRKPKLRFSAGAGETTQSEGLDSAEPQA
jgi:RecA/RadA recombinase